MILQKYTILEVGTFDRVLSVAIKNDGLDYGSVNSYLSFFAEPGVIKNSMIVLLSL